MYLFIVQLAFIMIKPHQNQITFDQVHTSPLDSI